MEQFIPGQRWISNAELQLGLGTLTESEHRTITIHFIACDETRIYAKQNAPLTRVIYAEGEQVKSIEGQSIKITHINDVDGLIIYGGTDSTGQSLTLKETQLDHNIQLNRPAERLFIGQIDKNHCFDLRYQTQQKMNELAHSELSGLTGCRTSLIAHQLYIAHEVATRYAPRVLLADEVGLGKTIEAGLILHHQLLHEQAQRVLIIVPESLMHQWLVEMLRRFNLMFSIFDQQRCQASVTEDEQSANAADNNPFLSEQLVLCSVEFLARNEQYYQQISAGEWDLLVVDEAHHLQWNSKQASHEYQLIEQLSRQIRGVLLLTATPEQLGVESHFARLRLLDPDRFPDLSAFINEEKSYQPIAQAMTALISNQPLDGQTHKLLSTLAGAKNPNESSREELIEHMLDRHGTGRVLFRNTRATIKGFPDRKVIAHPQALPETYAEILKTFSQSFLDNNEENLNSADHFSNLVLFPELLYQIEADNRGSAEHWTQLDPRVPWLAEYLLERRQSSENISDTKTLVISANASTAIDLADTLKRQFGIYAAVFHEQLSLVERDRASAFFADTENGTPVLICSEIGSEGRNFQFAHQMILFDLPLNPDLLEQRIGRLDRIGQTQNIQIHVPYLKHTAQELLFHWYQEGLNAFEHTCPAGHNVFTRVKTQLHHLLMTATDTQNINHSSALIKNTQTLHQELNQALHEGRDRLLEYNSCRQPEADQLKTLAEENNSQTELLHYMDELFDVFGIEHSDHSEHCYIIAPGDNMLNQFPGLAEDGMTITYDRDIALANEDMQFFTWEHPMVRTAMDMITSSEMGNTAVTTLDSSGLQIAIQPGSLLLECVFILETSSHKALQADRYLPTSTIRVLIDERGQDLSEHIHHTAIVPTEKIKKKIAQQIIKVKEDALRQMLKWSEDICLQQTPKLLDNAKKSGQHTLEQEINRLKALAQVNPNIREEEIDFFCQQLKSLDAIFTSVTPRLDALRAIIVT